MKETILAMKLKEYREKNKLTQSRLAELLEVSDKTISKWELGATYPSKKNMIKIAEELDISLETLLLEETKKDNEDLKVSIKYGVISFCLIFFVTMIITSFNQDFSRIMNLFIFISSLKIKKRTNHFLGFDRNGRLEYRNQVMDRKTHFR